MVQPPTCLRFMEPYGARTGPEFHITATGVDEMMPPCVVNRPKGTSSWLIMQFHDPVLIRADGFSEPSWFPPDSVMAWNETDGHYYGNPERSWKHSWIHFVGDGMAEMVEKAGIPLRAPFIFPRRERFNELVAQAYHETTAWKEPDSTILLSLLEILCRELGRTLRGGAASLPIPERLQVVMLHIDRHFEERLTLARLASVARLSVPQFCAEFKRHLGKAPIDFLIGLRMERARRLLGNRNLSVKEISRSVGYGDPFQFSKLFKRRFGGSPRELRKKQLLQE